MKSNIILQKINNNKGSGLGVILYGVTLLVILLFTAVNIVNSKVIEDGYNSLKDAVMTASSGSVIHLLTKDISTQAKTPQIIKADYDIYLQLALGYLINRTEPSDKNNVVQSGNINNFIKLDHQKVVNTTMAILEDAVIRDRDKYNINDTSKYKIMMFFIEPYEINNRKCFDIIAYGNRDYRNGNIERQLAVHPITISSESYENDADPMKSTYENIEETISGIVNCKIGLDESAQRDYGYGTEFNIKLNSTGSYSDKIRKMETYPHYIIVVKDFALPTIFDSKDTNLLKGVATSLSGDGTLSAPMCALNTGKVQRQVEDAGWSKNR